MATPLMDQYQHIKAQHPQEILLFRLGDFYEMFYEDAKVASRVLGIALTSRQKNENRIPMAGVPYHSCSTYINRLLKAGHRVAICEQTEDAEDAEGLVERAVVRVITPGTLIDEGILDEKRANFLAAVIWNECEAGLAWVDISTGKFVVEDTARSRLLDSLTRLSPSEVLIPSTLADNSSTWLEQIQRTLTGVLTPCADWQFDRDTAERTLLEHFGTANLAGFGCSDLGLSLSAAGTILAYLKETQKTALKHLRKIERAMSEERMTLDRQTLLSLEIVDVARMEARNPTLLSVLDKTLTGMGARLLREWLIAPLRRLPEIQHRQEAVAELFESVATRRHLQAKLKNLCDMERLTARIGSGRATPRDLVSLRETLQRLPEILEQLRTVKAAMLCDVARRIRPLPELAQFLAQALVDAPPYLLTEGGIIRQGFSEELDRLHSISSDGKGWLARFQAKESARTGIPSLKVGFNRVFGYYIEVTNVHAQKVPADYIRKQTLKDAERYITPELKDYETQVLNADERAKELEHELFLQVRDKTAESIPALQETARSLAELDCLLSLAQVAEENRYVLPTLDESLDIEIVEGRHPVLERALESAFVPNDVRLHSEEHSLCVITGPNMAGKSTYIRQTALIVLMAQMGSFVPAKSARLGMVDRIFTRIGASDELTRGLSTFMVEMNETANILNNATERSLIILDEIGRGTSTFDGVAIAWAVAEYLHEHIKARTLFATHYHELTELAQALKGVKNLRVAVKEWGEKIIFLHHIEEGATDRSYGIHVARLAGIPHEVVERAKVMLAELELLTLDKSDEPRLAKPKYSKGELQQLALYASKAKVVYQHSPLVEELKALDVNGLTPLQALQKLSELKEKAKANGDAGD